MLGPGPLFELLVANQLLDSQKLLQIWQRTRNQLIINGLSTVLMPMVTKRLNNVGLVGRFL